jgi:hypothetical protein
MIQEKEIEHEVKEMPQIQEEENETSQTQEEVEEVIEEISLRRSNRIPPTSTRLRDFVTYMVHYIIQDFISYENISYKAFFNHDL